jgi:hypothetical protein
MKGGGPVVVEALKARALPEGGCDRLPEFLTLYRVAFKWLMGF